MLELLRIKNLGLVPELTIELENGFNVITGETGAGKSMLIGALSLVLGERADRTLIRDGADSCSVEAAFILRPDLKSALASFFAETGIEPGEDDQLILRRTVAVGGSNRQFINGSPTSLSALSALGEWLVDIHGPHEHQSLLHPGKQLEILDAFGALQSAKDNFAAILRNRAELEAEKAALIVDEKSYAQQLDLLRFQVHEIETARLSPEEEAALQEEHTRGANSARLLELGQAALQALGEEDSSVRPQLGMAGRSIHEMAKLDTGAAALMELHHQATDLIDDLHSELSGYVEKVEIDPQRLSELEQRLNLVQSLKRKYGASLEEVINFGQEARRKLEALEKRDVEVERLNRQLAELEAALWDAGAALTLQRRKLVQPLTKAVGRELKDLGFAQSRLEIEMRSVSQSEVRAGTGRVTNSGFDSVEFQFAPNPGEPPRPLRSIASSGELARVMLALKTVLATQDRVPVLVFDEVDANVGGETGRSVGEKMMRISRQRQVICITHLPQVAAPARAHFLAEKRTESGRTLSRIRRLENSDRVTELARMLGGKDEASRTHAEAMLKAAGASV